MNFRLESGRKTFTIKGVAIDGFNLRYKLIADSNNTTPLGIDLTQVRVKSFLHQADEKFEIIPSTPVAPLHIDKYVVAGTPTQHGVNPDGVYSGVVTVLPNATVKGVKEGKTSISFSGGIVLKGNDYITFELSIGGNAFSSNCNSDSYIVLEPNEVVTNQLYVPSIVTMPINSGQSNFIEPIGDNIQTITALSIDKSILISQSPFVNFTLESDRLNYNTEYSASLADRVEEGNYQNTCAFKLLKGREFDNVHLDIELNASNVTNSMCWVVVRGFEIDSDVYRSGQMRAIKHNSRNKRKWVS